MKERNISRTDNADVMHLAHSVLVRPFMFGLWGTASDKSDYMYYAEPCKAFPFPIPFTPPRGGHRTLWVETILKLLYYSVFGQTPQEE